MPIDLSEYTPRKRKHLRSVKACCVYVIGSAESGPLKVGIAGDIVQRFRQIDESGSARQVVHYILWTPGRPVAQRIENYVHSLLFKAGRAIKGEWFNVDVEAATTTVKWAARSLYPHASLYSHRKIIDQMDKKLMERPRRSRAVDSLQKISDFPQIPDLRGIASPASGYKNPHIEISEALAAEEELLRSMPSLSTQN